MFLVFFLCAALISITSFLDDIFTNMRCSRTLELANNLATLGAFTGKILGIVPFRDKWFGRSQSKV